MSRDRSWALPAGVVFAVALAARFIYAAQVSSCPLFQTPTIDAGVYYDLARQLASGHWLNPAGEPYWQPPLYPFALAAWIKLFGASVAAIKHAQLVLGAVNCVLTMVLGARIFGRRIGLIAGLAAAVCAPMIYFDGELLTPTLQTFLNLVAMLALLSAVERRSIALFAAAGLVLGFSLILRPDVALFVIVATIWAAAGLRQRMPARRPVAALALMLVCVAIPVMPVMVRNVVVGKDFVPISSNGGLNFYIGNNPDYDRTFGIRPGPEWDAMQHMATKANPQAKASEQSAFFYRTSLNWAVRHPLAYAGLTLKKAVIYLTAIEVRRNHDIYYYRHYSSFYRALLFKTRFFAFPLGIVLPLAVMGIAARGRHSERSEESGAEIPRCARNDKHGSALLLCYLAAQFVITVAFFVCSRYRVTSVPVMLIFAAVGAVELWRIGRERDWRRSTTALTLAAIALVVTNANIYRVDRRQDLLDATTHDYLGQIAFNRRDFKTAEKELRRSIALNPDDEVARFMHAGTLRALNRPEEARRELLECLQIDPGSPAAHADLGGMLARQGDLAGAEHHLEKAARTDSMFVDHLVHLAEKAYAAKDYPVAERALRTVVSIRPRYAEARRSLGVTLMKEGRLAESAAELRRACKLAPNSAESYIALGLAYQRAGQSGASRAAFDRAIAIGPEDEIRARIRRALASH